jgi:hypothetical protein
MQTRSELNAKFHNLFYSKLSYTQRLLPLFVILHVIKRCIEAKVESNFPEITRTNSQFYTISFKQ